MIHGYLNLRGANFLKYHKHCGAVAIELVTYTGEVPDVIGFKQSCSYLIESKTSRNDFFADKKKPHRHKSSTLAAGNYRYYLCAENLIQADEVPDKWGLLWLNNKTVTIIKEVDKSSDNRHEVRAEIDRAMLYSISRRLSKPQFTKRIPITL